MTIATQASTDFNDRTRGLNNAKITVNGNYRIFEIDDGSVEDALVVVNLKDLDLKGASERLNNIGGLILNREDLRIEYSRLIGVMQLEAVQFITQVRYQIRKRQQEEWLFKTVFLRTIKLTKVLLFTVKCLDI